MNLAIISALFLFFQFTSWSTVLLPIWGKYVTGFLLLVFIYTDGNAMLKTSKRLERNGFFVIIFPNLQFPKTAL